MDDATRHEYLTLLSWTGAQTAGVGALLRECGSPAAALAADEARLAELPPASQQCLAAARRHWPRPRSAAAVSVPARGAARDDVFLPIGDPRYPDALRNAQDPPPWLFCRGDPHCLERPAVAIVGARRASQAGLQAAHGIARRLAASGYVVCSGLALGIDAAAHRGALESGVTVAVLASGLDRASPHRHRDLAREIAARGCLVSELPYGTQPAKARFPRRNRIISGLCRATVIVEAGQPSGTLHTAAAALEQGREVYVLPWSIFHPQGEGCLRLLRDGATPVTSLDDLPHLFPPLPDACAASLDAAGCGAPASRRDTAAAVPPLARDVLSLVGDGALAVEDLQRMTRQPTPELLELLAMLELEGYLVRIDGLYQRRP